jgi:hypothetical protein
MSENFEINDSGIVFEGTVNEVSYKLAEMAWLFGLGIDFEGYGKWVETATDSESDLAEIDKVNEWTLEWINEVGTSATTEMIIVNDRTKVILTELE